MKAISPMIAVVLLLAFTVAVGGILSVWFTSFTRTTTGGVESATVNQTRCAGVYLDVEKVFDLGGNIGASNTDTRVIYSNPSTETITSIDLISNAGESFYGTTTSLDPGKIGKADFNRSGTTKIIIKGICLATVPVEGSCELGDTCWKL